MVTSAGHVPRAGPAHVHTRTLWLSNDTAGPSHSSPPADSAHTRSHKVTPTHTGVWCDTNKMDQSHTTRARRWGCQTGRIATDDDRSTASGATLSKSEPDVCVCALGTRPRTAHSWNLSQKGTKPSLISLPLLHTRHVSLAWHASHSQDRFFWRGFGGRSLEPMFDLSFDLWPPEPPLLLLLLLRKQKRKKRKESGAARSLCGAATQAPMPDGAQTFAHCRRPCLCP